MFGWFVKTYVSPFSHTFYLFDCPSLCPVSPYLRATYRAHKAIYLQTDSFTVYYLHNILSFMWDICFFLLTLPSMEEG